MPLISVGTYNNVTTVNTFNLLQQFWYYTATFFFRRNVLPFEIAKGSYDMPSCLPFIFTAYVCSLQQLVYNRVLICVIYEIDKKYFITNHFAGEYYYCKRNFHSDLNLIKQGVRKVTANKLYRVETIKAIKIMRPSERSRSIIYQ